MAVLDGEKDTLRLKLSGTQWDLAKEVVGVLKPLQMATTVLCMDTNPSLSCVYPVVHGLVNQHLVLRDGECPSAVAEGASGIRLGRVVPLAACRR